MKRQIFVRPLHNERGQGITEYILLLIIILAMILGGMYQLNTAFEKWANAYFGEYLSCLLETGELPSIGGAPGDSGICNEFFEEFSLANGRRLKGGDPSGGGGDGGGYGDGSLRESQDRRNEGGSGGRGGGIREQVSGGSYVSSGFGRGSSGTFGAQRQSQGSSSRQQKERSKYTGSTESSLPDGAGYTQGGSRLGRPRYVAVSGRRIVDIEERERQVSGQTANIRRDSASAPNAQKLRINRQNVKKDMELQDEPMSFGNYLRLFIIAAIVIALALLIGGQMLQASKNSE